MNVLKGTGLKTVRAFVLLSISFLVGAAAVILMIPAGIDVGRLFQLSGCLSILNSSLWMLGFWRRERRLGLAAGLLAAFFFAPALALGIEFVQGEGAWEASGLVEWALFVGVMSGNWLGFLVSAWVAMSTTQRPPAFE